IKVFTPEKYWEIYANLESDNSKFKAIHVDGQVFEEERVNAILENSKSDQGTVKEVEIKEVNVYPPVPFDLGELQAEAYRIFRYTPKKTQSIAQTLYESGVISYPRTSSQKLPYSLGFKWILEKLGKNPKYKTYTETVLEKEKLRPRQGKKTDPAHPAIYPTGILPKKMTKDQDALYGLVVHRFLALFGDPQLREDSEILISIGKEDFKTTGSKTISPGWIELYPYRKIRDNPLPQLTKGDNIKVLKIDPVQKETKPPRRYNPASLIKELESRNLGTKATRADIIDTLYKRNYIVGIMMEATVLGTKVIEALEQYVPEIISEKLTRRFEDKIEGIRYGKEEKEVVLQEAKDELLNILEEFRENDEKIGEVLKLALEEVYRKRYVVGKCPNCGHDLRIIRAKVSKKTFIGCSNYPECSTSYPLPQITGIRTTDKLCKTCGLPMVSIPFKRRRILSCVDMNCPSKKRKKKSS
ncbi:MAG: DNA topoisomerase I, partial [Candidatus Hydrothermarchaeales archaeon]